MPRKNCFEDGSSEALNVIKAEAKMQSNFGLEEYFTFDKQKRMSDEDEEYYKLFNESKNNLKEENIQGM